MKNLIALIAIFIALIALPVSADVFVGGFDPALIKDWDKIHEGKIPDGRGGHLHEYYYLNPDLSQGVIITAIVTDCPDAGGMLLGVVYRIKRYKTVHFLRWNPATKLLDYDSEMGSIQFVQDAWNKDFDNVLLNAGIGTY